MFIWGIANTISLQAGISQTRNYLSTMPGENPRDLMLTDLIPTGTRCEVIDVHEAGVEIAGKCKAFVEDQRYTVIAVSRRVEDLSVQANPGKKFSAVFHLQHEIVILCNGNVGKFLAFEEFGEGRDEVPLAFQEDQLYALVF